jgi:hypothetical protein
MLVKVRFGILAFLSPNFILVSYGTGYATILKGRYSSTKFDGYFWVIRRAGTILAKEQTM